MTVEWRTIPGYPGYEVSNEGVLISHRRGRPRIIHGSLVQGYRRANIPNERGDLTIALIHRLVLLAFVGPPPEGHICRHLDGDRTNNRLENLRWGTFQENADDMVRHGTHRAWAAELTECHNGHPYTPENTARSKLGHRRCKACARALVAARRRLRAEGAELSVGTAPACANGHPYSPENTAIRDDGYRQCKTCKRASHERRKAARREQARAALGESKESAS